MTTPPDDLPIKSGWLLMGKEAFGERLKSIRKKMPLSVLDFCAALGVAKSTQYIYEHGTHEPSVTYLKKLISLTGLTADHILYGRKNQPIRPDLVLSILKEFPIKLSGTELERVFHFSVDAKASPDQLRAFIKHAFPQPLINQEG